MPTSTADSKPQPIDGRAYRVRVAHNKLDRDAFVVKATAVHGSKYGYSRVVYIDTKTKVGILCPFDGLFQQTPEKHMAGQGCPKCKASKPKFTLEEFIAKSRSIHGDLYDYSNSIYLGSKAAVEIICVDHGSFWQVVEYHWDGNGCPQCGIIKRSASQRMNTVGFVHKAKEIHGDKYDYTATVYRTYRGKVHITCLQHGPFSVAAEHHLLAQIGCPACGKLSRSDTQRKELDQYIHGANVTHGDRYDYSRAVYAGAKEKVEIVCKRHGSFFQEASSHISGRGCPSCCDHYTRPHKSVEAFVQSLGIEFESNTRSVIPPKELDVYIPSKALAIELNGTYWHALTGKEPPAEKKSHLLKYQLCRDRGISLLQIDEHEWTNAGTKAIWESIIASKAGLQLKVAARKTAFKEISASEADAFLCSNHLQGTTLHRWRYGLFFQGGLVGVIVFAEHEKRSINLSRLAFKANLTVVGGARKLFVNAVSLLPPGKDIVTFSNNRYSSGSVYPILGFQRDAAVPPSYQWFFKNRVHNKRMFRHSRLAVALGNGYNPNETEHQNMYRNGGRCLYDAGYQRWLFRRC